MEPLINSYQMTVGDREFLLVDINNSSGQIGTFKIKQNVSPKNSRTRVNEIFYVGNEPIISMLKNNESDPFANKMISQIGDMSSVDVSILSSLSNAADNYFVYNQSMLKSLQPILELAADGLYVCHTSKMLPCDGAGNFFWNAYHVRHEIAGSSDFDNVIGKDNNYIPCFLVPTKASGVYSDQTIRQSTDKIKLGKKVGGVAFHLSGLFCALLDGHHAATACITNDAPFSCLVIEPVNQVLYEPDAVARENGRKPRIVALSTPYVKIPIGGLPDGILENFLLRRKNALPANIGKLKRKINRAISRTAKRSFPKTINDKCELLPDVPMIESAAAVNELTEPQLEALLAGEVSYENEIIINENYYNSIVIACNYLQYFDYDRFIDFALAILENPDLIATHKYIIGRLDNLMNSKVYRFYRMMVDSENPLHQDLIPLVETYIQRYDGIAEEVRRDTGGSGRLRENVFKRKTDLQGIQKMQEYMSNKK